MPRIGFKASQSQSFSPLPKGTYQHRIESVEEGTAKSSGNPQLMVKTVIENDDSYTDRKVTLWFSMVEAALWRLRAFAEAAIPDKVDIVETDEMDAKGKPMSTIDFDTDDLVGATFMADATIRQSDNGDQNDWKNFRPVGGAEASAEGGEEQQEEEQGEEQQEEEEEQAPPPARTAGKPAQTQAKPAQNAGKPAQGKPAQAQGKPAQGKTQTQAAPANGQRQRTRLQA